MKTITKIVMDMYLKNETFFKRSAKYVLKNFYSIPIVEDDLISYCLQKLIDIGEKYNPDKRCSIEQFLYANVKYIMYSYCRIFTKKNNEVLNNYVDFDLIENYYSQTYTQNEINFDFLTSYQKEIIDDLYVKKLTTKEVALKNTTTSHLINKEVIKIKEIIKNKMDNNLDFS